MTRGYINVENRSYNTRLLSINMNGIGIRDNEKIQQLIDFCEKNKVDFIQVIETNSKWNTVMESIMKQKFRRLSRSLEVVLIDSKAHSTTKNNWL